MTTVCVKLQGCATLTATLSLLVVDFVIGYCHSVVLVMEFITQLVDAAMVIRTENNAMSCINFVKTAASMLVLSCREMLN